MRALWVAFMAAVVCSTAQAAAPAHCTASSGERRVALLELYTSEGCDSCPPVDKWLSELPARGFGPDRVVALAFHVDYWDYIGWRDPFAQARFSERQRAANARSGSRRIYTPQLMLNGKDFRGAAGLAAKLSEIGRIAPQAAIRIAAATAAGRLPVSGTWSTNDPAAGRYAQGWLALYENNLSTEVRAGENRGRRLHHDFVVRDVAGPFPAGELKHTFAIDPRWKAADLGVAAYVVDVRSGESLQALALPGCRAPS